MVTGCAVRVGESLDWLAEIAGIDLPRRVVTQGVTAYEHSRSRHRSQV